jgi:hypothetical protein
MPHPRHATWWIGALFAIGSVCFFVGPFPGFVNLIGAAADGAVFFVGSLFFTTAASLQFLSVRYRTHPVDWWSTAIQLVGTVFFNINTFRALQDAIDSGAVDRVIWRPELLGSICFLVSGLLAYGEVRQGGFWRAERTPDWRIAAVNLGGCVLFMISTLAGYVVPDTGDVVSLAVANAGTSLGALCFLYGAVATCRRSS